MARRSGTREVWLCLSGGNALGAYHAGAYQALHSAGIEPTRIAGASIGGIIGAIIAGNKAEDRMGRLAAFWSAAADKLSIANTAPQLPGSKIAASLATLIHGRPGVFGPAVNQWWRRAMGLSSPSLFERSALRQVLERLIDFDRLNGGPIRLIVNAVDVETGEEIIFDTAETTFTAGHLMATSAFPVLYSPERIGDRSLVDGGLSANLPVRALFRDLPASDIACMAFDLVSPCGTAPSSMDEALHRAQDLVLSRQSLHAIALLQRELKDHAKAVSLLHVTYDGEGEVGGKMLEFSAASMKSRHDAGMRDATVAVGWLDGSAPVDGTTMRAWTHSGAAPLRREQFSPS